MMEIQVIFDCEEPSGKTHGMIQGSPTLCLERDSVEFLYFWNLEVNQHEPWESATQASERSTGSCS